MHRRSFLSIIAGVTGSCLIPPAIAKRIHEVCVGESSPLILAPERYSNTFFARESYGTYQLHLGDPDADPKYPTLREFMEDHDFYPDDEESVREYLLQWRGYGEEDFEDSPSVLGWLESELDQAITDRERDHWLEWDYEIRESTLAAAYRHLIDLPLKDDSPFTGYRLGGLSFIEGPYPGSNLTFVEVDSLAAIAALQFRLNELDTGDRIVIG